MYNLLEERFRNIAIERAGILFFDPKNALLFAQISKKEGYKILGIDGFFLKKESTQPSMEDSINFTDNLKSNDENYTAAFNFLEKYKNKDIYFEIICEEYQSQLLRHFLS